MPFGKLVKVDSFAFPVFEYEVKFFPIVGLFPVFRIQCGYGHYGIVVLGHDICSVEIFLAWRSFKKHCIYVAFVHSSGYGLEFVFRFACVSVKFHECSSGGVFVISFEAQRNTAERSAELGGFKRLAQCVGDVELSEEQASRRDGLIY